MDLLLDHIPNNYIDFHNLLACHGQQKTSKLNILKIKDLKTTNKDHKKQINKI